MLSANTSISCPRCGSGRVASGSISGALEPATFQPDETKLLALGFLSGTPSSIQLDRACACIQCGLDWADISSPKLRAVIEKWGKQDLKARLLNDNQDPK